MMNRMLRAKIIKIGNSRGIRIPRVLLEQAGLVDEVELIVQENQLIIQPARIARQDWGEQFARMAERGDDRLLDEPTPTQFDEEEWVW
jgi:antitoxin MazE